MEATSLSLRTSEWAQLSKWGGMHKCPYDKWYPGRVSGEGPNNRDGIVLELNFEVCRLVNEGYGEDTSNRGKRLNILCKTMISEAGEMVQWVGALAAFTKDPGSVHNTRIPKQLKLLGPIPEDLAPSTGLHEHCMPVVHRHTCKLMY